MHFSHLVIRTTSLAGSSLTSFAFLCPWRLEISWVLWTLSSCRRAPSPFDKMNTGQIWTGGNQMYVQIHCRPPYFVMACRYMSLAQNCLSVQYMAFLHNTKQSILVVFCCIQMRSLSLTITCGGIGRICLNMHFFFGPAGSCAIGTILFPSCLLFRPLLDFLGGGPSGSKAYRDDLCGSVRTTLSVRRRRD